jgi:hypothetical protein
MPKRAARASLPLCALALLVLLHGCHDNRKPDPMPDPDKPSATHSDPPQAPASAPPVKAKLAEAVEKAAAGQAHGLHLHFQRGH